MTLRTAFGMPLDTARGSVPRSTLQRELKRKAGELPAPLPRGSPGYLTAEQSADLVKIFLEVIDAGDITLDMETSRGIMGEFMRMRGIKLRDNAEEPSRAFVLDFVAKNPSIKLFNAKEMAPVRITATQPNNMLSFCVLCDTLNKIFPDADSYVVSLLLLDCWL